MLAGIDDLPERLNGLPQLVVGGGERHRSEADDVRGAEVGDDAAGFEGPRDPRRLVMLDGEVTTPPLRLAGGADGEACREAR